MRNVHMWRTVETRVGPLKEGKSYHVPDDVADALVSDGVAVDLDAPQPERAVSGAAEDAAKQSKRPKRTTRAKATSTGTDDE